MQERTKGLKNTPIRGTKATYTKSSSFVCHHQPRHHQHQHRRKQNVLRPPSNYEGRGLPRAQKGGCRGPARAKEYAILPSPRTWKMEGGREGDQDVVVKLTDTFLLSQNSPRSDRHYRQGPIYGFVRLVCLPFFFLFHFDIFVQFFRVPLTQGLELPLISPFQTAKYVCVH